MDPESITQLFMPSLKGKAGVEGSCKPPQEKRPVLAMPVSPPSSSVPPPGLWSLHPLGWNTQGYGHHRSPLPVLGPILTPQPQPRSFPSAAGPTPDQRDRRTHLASPFSTPAG